MYNPGISAEDARQRTRNLTGLVRDTVGRGVSEYLSTGRIDFLQSSDIERTVEEFYATVERSSNVTITRDEETLIDGANGESVVGELRALLGDPGDTELAIVLSYGSSVWPGSCPYRTSIEERDLYIEGVDHPLWADLDFE